MLVAVSQAFVYASLAVAPLMVVTQAGSSEPSPGLQKGARRGSIWRGKGHFRQPVRPEAGIFSTRFLTDTFWTQRL